MQQPDTAALPESMLRRIQKLAEERLGLENRPGKELLLSIRAARHMRELRCADPAVYLQLLEEDRDGTRIQGLLDLLTTNHTAFWREPAHFEWFMEHLRREEKNRKQMTVWCAAASSGEEPYTLAMAAAEVHGEAAPQRLRILATDVSLRMLRTGIDGVYGTDRLATLPSGWADKYFEKVQRSGGGHWQIREDLRAMVHFRQLNLMQPFPRMGPFPVIFCRNVMIYFSQHSREDLMRRLLQMLRPGGYLVVGHAEGLSGMLPDADYVQPAVYRRSGSLQGPAIKDSYRNPADNADEKGETWRR